MKKGIKKFAVTGLVAGAAGYVAGILTAPKSGKETRQDIKQAASKAKTEAERKLKELHSELGHLIEKGKSILGRLTHTARSDLEVGLKTATKAKESARELLSALHEGDADDKDLKKALGEVNQAVENLKKHLAKHG